MPPLGDLAQGIVLECEESIALDPRFTTPLEVRRARRAGEPYPQVLPLANDSLPVDTSDGTSVAVRSARRVRPDGDRAVLVTTPMSIFDNRPEVETPRSMPEIRRAPRVGVPAINLDIVGDSAPLDYDVSLYDSDSGVLEQLRSHYNAVLYGRLTEAELEYIRATEVKDGPALWTDVETRQAYLNALSRNIMLRGQRSAAQVGDTYVLRVCCHTGCLECPYNFALLGTHKKRKMGDEPVPDEVRGRLDRYVDPASPPARLLLYRLRNR